MRRSARLFSKTWVVALAAVAMAACSNQREEREDARLERRNRTRTGEPAHITVDHILVGVRGPKIPGGLSVPKARKLAHSLLGQLKKNPSLWPSLKRRYTKDPGPGVYGMANHGVAPNPGETERGGMVNAFGNVGFKLEVGEIGIADHHVKDSPFGFHIIKRVK